jgi:tetratricopeptide (TPR) repeat protein
MRNGEYEKAEEALLESIQLLRDYGSLPPASLANLAMHLNNHGILLWHKGRLSEAKAALEEALEISHKKVPEYYNGLATISNLAVILADNDELKAAELHFQSALSIVENLAQRTPEQYKFYQGIVLHNYSHFLRKAGRQTEAYSQLGKTIELKRGLVKEYPRTFEASLAVSLSNLAVMLREDNSPDADDAFQEAYEMRKRIPQPSSKEMAEEEKWQMEWEEKYVTLEE